MFLHPLTLFALFAGMAAGLVSGMRRIVAPPLPHARRRFDAPAANDARYRPGGADIYPFAAPGRGALAVQAQTGLDTAS